MPPSDSDDSDTNSYESISEEETESSEIKYLRHDLAGEKLKQDDIRRSSQIQKKKRKRPLKVNLSCL